MSAPVETILKELRRRLDSIYGDRLERLVLFGSRARGDADPDSDIDVMVVLKSMDDPRSEADRAIAISADLSLEYGSAVMPIVVDANTYVASDWSLYRNVRREGVKI